MAFSFKQLRYFVAAVEAGKVTEAALDINISPSSITEAIKDLEYTLGATLFIRTKKGLDLTQEGFRFLVHAKRILSDVEHAKHAILDDRSVLSGKIRIGATITVTSYFLADLLKRFRHTFPNVEVEIVEKSREALEADIDQGDLDVAILLISNVKSRKNRNLVALMRSERRLWTPVDHPLAEKNIVDLKEISEQPYIQLLIDEAEATTSNFWKKYGLCPKTCVRTFSVEAVRSLVATGAGVTILSDMVHRPWSLEGEKIETVEIRQSIPSMDTGLLWSARKESSAMVKQFVNFCRLQYTSGNPVVK